MGEGPDVFGSEVDVAIPTGGLVAVLVSVVEGDCGFLGRRVAIKGK